jgi:hypothetical protein
MGFQDFANPLVRGRLQLYPEDSGKKLHQGNQARKWLHTMDPDLLSPMHRIGTADYYIYEAARLKDGTMCMPIRWYQKSGRMWCRAWRMVVSAYNGTSGWIIEQGDELTFSDDTLSMCGKDLFNGAYLGRNVPPTSLILGMFLFIIIIINVKVTCNSRDSGKSTRHC